MTRGLFWIPAFAPKGPLRGGKDKEKFVKKEFVQMQDNSCNSSEIGQGGGFDFWFF